MPVGTPSSCGPAARSRPMEARSWAIGNRPMASARPTRAQPFRSAIAVGTMSTVLSGSSTQSTGTSAMRRPICSARTKSSVSKNQPVSATNGSSSRAMSVRMALNPHCASENRAPIAVRSIRLYEREMNSRLGPRTTRAERLRRVPIAMSECRDTSGAMSGIRALRSVERSTSQYATISASLCCHTALSARPRPFCSRWTTRTPSSSPASATAISRVSSVLALSATVIRDAYGTCARRWSARRRTDEAMSSCSL